MTSSDQNGGKAPSPRRGMSRRFAWLAFAIVAAIGLYTAGWFYLAGQLEAKVAAALGKARDRGAEADCTKAQARGYPFRIGLFCDGVAYADREVGVSLSGTGLRSAAQVYQPSRLVGELDRLSIDLARAGLELDLSDIRYSARLAQPLPDLVSVSGSGLSAAELSGARLAAAAAGQAHMRPRGPDLDLAGSVSQLRLEAASGAPPDLPALDGEWDVTLKDGVTLVRSTPRSLRGLSSEIRNMTVKSGTASIGISGPFAVDQAGLVDATLTIAIADPAELISILRRAFPDMRPQLGQAEAVLGALGDTPQLPLTISKGEVRMGFFSVGRIPPVE
ncbi:MAG: DUF2125 domain-containing protein [Mesorhizobium sp.]|nr:DUF2125 domain-containing protein [Mesorhizobium sp.]MCO5161758.1 DUF2125 domain-containing protein [Mesorhizobium sp.]